MSMQLLKNEMENLRELLILFKESTALLREEIKELETKVQKHNAFNDRLIMLEQNLEPIKKLIQHLITIILSAVMCGLLVLLGLKAV